MLRFVLLLDGLALWLVFTLTLGLFRHFYRHVQVSKVFKCIRAVSLVLTCFAGELDLVRGQRVEHAAEDLDVASVRQLLEKLVQASLDDVTGDEVKLEQLDYKLHIAMHLVLLPHLKLILIKEQDSLSVEILAQVIFQHGFLHRGTPLSSICLLSLQHLVELLLAAIEEQLSEVHLGVLRVIKLFEEADAEFDVQIKIGCLRCRLGEYYLHELEQQRWIVVEASHQLMLDSVEVVFRNLIQLHAQTADLCRELVLCVFFCAKQGRLIQFDLSLFVGQNKERHVVWARPAFLLKRHHEIDRVGLAALLLILNLLLLALLLLHIDGFRVWVLVATEIIHRYAVRVHSRLLAVRRGLWQAILLFN